MKQILRKILGLDDWGPLSSWRRVEFDWTNYFRLRDDGLTHNQAIEWLDREWNRRLMP